MRAPYYVMTKTLKSGVTREYHIKSYRPDTSLARMILIQADLMRQDTPWSAIAARYGLNENDRGVARALRNWQDELAAANYMMGYPAVRWDRLVKNGHTRWRKPETSREFKRELKLNA